MKQLWEQFPVRVLCQALDVAPSSYYYHPHRTDDLRVAIEAVALEYPRYGYRRVHAELDDIRTNLVRGCSIRTWDTREILPG